MSRPPLEVADIVRAQGNRFIRTSCRWIHWSHRKVLLAIARCRTVKTKMSTVLFHHFDFRSVADHLPLLCFVQHSSQRPQSAIGIRGRAWKFQLLSEISRDLVDSQTRNGCRFE